MSEQQGGPVISEEQERRAQAILQQITDLGATVFFEKPLTASDTAGSGRVVIPKAIAEQYFPKLEQPSGLPVRAVDTRGHEYQFKFRFWINNQSRMYLLEGAGELHRQFTMSVGDVMVFAQKEDKTLVIAGRPATKNDVIRKAPVKRALPPGEVKPRTPKEGGKGKAGKGAGGGAAGLAAGAADQRKRRAKGPGNSTGLPGGSNDASEPPVDGIFRAVPHAVSSSQPSSILPGRNGRWIATLNLAGELYQAYFDTQEDACEAFNAAGGTAEKDSKVAKDSSTAQATEPSPQPPIEQQPDTVMTDAADNA